MIDLDPACLRAFVAVVEAGGFTRAGQKLHRTQSAISMQIRRLEEALGAQLIADRKKATLTAAGERILDHARRMMALNDEMIGRARGADIAGRVRIGTPDDYVSFFLPRMLRHLSITHPQVEVEVRCSMSSDLIPQVDHGILDFALITRSIGIEDGTPLRREPLIWVANNDALVRRRPLPLAMFSPGCRFREATLKSLENAEIPFRIAYESPSVAGVAAAVSEGLAIAAVVRLSLTPEMKPVDPRAGLPVLPDVEIALYGPRGVASPAAKAVRQSLLEELSGLMPERVAA